MSSTRIGAPVNAVNVKAKGEPVSSGGIVKVGFAPVAAIDKTKVVELVIDWMYPPSGIYPVVKS